MVSIVILSYNTQDLLKKCITSVISHLHASKYEIIVVDNASADDSVDMVKKDFEKVKLIQNKKNLGFTKGNNIGARSVSGEHILFLNSDTQIVSDKLWEIEKLFQENPTIGVIGGALINKDGTSQRSFGKFYSLPQIFRLLFLGEKIETSFVKSRLLIEVDWVSGGCMVIRKDVFEEVHGFDENIFMYVEDMELCFRVKKHGYTVHFSPLLEAFHVGQGSSNRTFAIVQIYKSMQYFYTKHKSTGELLLLRIMLRVKAFSAIIIGLLTHNSYLIETYKKALTVL